ncbi:hypothetical protein DDB_G0294330 [Dictyostelium discoideum AX4]|nr:hypothetical protein DDB_G0294330 [Dictyostelium discoideum AX4]EAL60321.1 hypothetical protein DDB_G0294330 [Dictyostelium discoideum AX4]|eukprot:XP_628734.1 hypothetical protein DDB_G0294330 [Dictyostelium discoideum AX4]
MSLDLIFKNQPVERQNSNRDQTF